MHTDVAAVVEIESQVDEIKLAWHHLGLSLSASGAYLAQYLYELSPR